MLILKRRFTLLFFLRYIFNSPFSFLEVSLSLFQCSIKLEFSKCDEFQRTVYSELSHIVIILKELTLKRVYVSICLNKFSRRKFTSPYYSKRLRIKTADAAGNKLRVYRKPGTSANFRSRTQMVAGIKWAVSVLSN